MLLFTDFGCALHPLRHLRFFGPEAMMVKDVFANLPADGDCHTYICEHGNNHRLMVEVQLPETLTDRLFEQSRVWENDR